MHGEDEDWRLLVVEMQPPDEGESAERASAHGKIDLQGIYRSARYDLPSHPVCDCN